MTIRPAMTIRRIPPSHSDKEAQTTSQSPSVQSSILSNILTGHTSVTDAVTRLQRERDLALHDYYNKELKKKDDADHKMAQWHKGEHQNQIRAAQNETAQYKMQFEQAMSLIETQKLSIKLLQDELGEEAEFDAEETVQMRSIRRECETRVNNYEDKMIQLQSDMQKDIDKQVYLLKKVTKEREEARNESNESQQSARNIFNEQKRLEYQMDRSKDEVSRSNKAVDKMRDEVVRLRSKINELRDEKSDLKKQHESHIADEESAARERDIVIADLRSLLDRRN